MKMNVAFLLVALAVVTQDAFAQTCSTSGTNSFFTHCQAASPFTYNGNYTLDMFTPTETVGVVVTDLTGLLVKQYTMDLTNRLTVDLNPGTYLVKISTGDFNKAIRVVVP